MVVGVHENHLSLLLRNFNNNLYLSYMSKLNSLAPKLRDNDIRSEIEFVKSHDLAGDIAFRMEFGFPVFVMLSHPICRFRSRRNYPIREGTYIAQMGLVPVFFSSLNIMTVMILYDERTEGFFSPISSPLSDTEIICWELPESVRPATYSSMNFLLQNGSEARIAERYYGEACVKYFNFGYWAAPMPGFIPSTHFLHGRKQVTCIVKVAKSLLTVEEIGLKRTVNIEGHGIECRNIRLNILSEKDGTYFFKRYDALIETEFAERLEKEKRVRSGFLNAMIAELQYTGGRKEWMLTVIADYGDSYFQLLQSLIGIVAYKKYYPGDRLSYIGTMGELREKVFDAFVDIRRKIQLPTTVSDYVESSYDFALSSMFPMIVIDGQSLYYAHPLLLGFIKKWNLFGSDDKANREMLVQLLKLLDKTADGTYMKVFLSEEAEFFQKKGLPKTSFVQGLTKVGRLIRMAKMIDNTWAQFPR